MPTTETIRPDDVVVGLLALLSGKEYVRFKADPVNVHSSFYRWRQRPASLKLFDQFVFDKRDYFPYSETLDRVFESLQLAGYLERTNPRGIYYVIGPEVKTLFQNDVKPKFREKQLKALEALADEFVQEIKPQKKRVG